ncbi:hypothetical protein BCR36DRAFT_411698 [Piromyces finnis]|uniref:Transcription factor TFIIIC triple barrel domain-containing protein n=1 Tax=Piromyces finnis TaxID=1754191 RepID=A0A1Y1VC59_9FUNG|nr:hypothetical protein BCR36DRAFT_411698 [Piromyces finnis]|eukprot:ORX52259.1 hypothetical protein BCR36DRAFT_411698 [Piromyces finnis]
MLKEDKPSSSDKMEVDSEDEWEEESTYMIMDLGSDLTIDLLKRSLEINNGYSLIGLDTDQPMFKIGNFVYKGEVDYSLGTDLIFEVDENKINNNNKDNLESSIHPSNASLKQSSSLYSYLTGENSNNSSKDFPLIPLTQTTKKMVFHSVLLEQKDDELSGKEKLPQTLIPNLSPNTLFMNKDSLLNSMAVDNGNISPIIDSDVTAPSKTDATKSKTIEKITLMDAVSQLVDEKAEESKKERIDQPAEQNNTEISQTSNPEISNITNTETTEVESNDTSSQIINASNTEIENTEVSQITSEGITETDVNELSQSIKDDETDKNNNDITDSIKSEEESRLSTIKETQKEDKITKNIDNNEISQSDKSIYTINSTEVSQMSNTENSNAIAISSTEPTPRTASPTPMDIDSNVPIVPVKRNSFRENFEKIKKEINSFKKTIEDNKASIKLLKADDIKKQPNNNKKKSKAAEGEKPKRGPGRPRKKKSVDNITTSTQDNSSQIDEKQHIKKVNPTRKSNRGRKPKSATTPTTSDNNTSKKSGPIEKYFNK